MSWTDKNAEMRDQLRVMNRAIPEVAKGFGALSKAAKDAQVLDVKTLEFVALGIAIADRCEACIGFHVEALAKAGGTRAELGDVLGMAVQMGGGPSLMYAAKALTAWDDLTAEK
ncbi:carboxymuconolactone decarboxylase family protein [Pseudorhodobacter sp. E13]|uniref:carboxymuconolactone decarboxylase family protein n=1 Tax=Pseudorhodobacter sp. E13 TaxID=2487931 RepID=UPI000F8EB39B|nr:carboxymuconolactone decarboxylase family protein [Pseudorhodobacter sp. E13]RUS60891.1 carboxymuconolactone decarboxylase family protein [Pseudorhodobacter sp. E13]